MVLVNTGFATGILVFIELFKIIVDGNEEDIVELAPLFKIVA